MSDALLVLNAGSSSLKFSVFLDEERPQLLLRGQLDGLLTQARFGARDSTGVIGEKEWPSGTPLGHHGAIDFLFAWGRGGALGEHRIVAAGHRVVHGGAKYAEPILIDGETLADLEALTPLAPLHQPHNVAAIKAVARRVPDLPQVACFDTAFHRAQPALAQIFALPRRYAEEGVRRYGFHGLSYEYIASVLPTIDRRAAEGRTVVAHLGKTLRPKEVRFVDALPKTRSAKIVRGVIRRRWLGEPVGDLASVENPDAVEAVATSR